MNEIDWNECPPSVAHSLKMYYEDGSSVGGFLQAVLSNDLFGAYGRADMTNTECMREIVMFIYNYLPVACHGSDERIQKWKGINNYIKEINNG